MKSPSSPTVVQSGSSRFRRQLVSVHERRGPIVLIATPGLTRAAATAQARAISAELARPLQRVDLGALTGKYIGETEKNLARMLDRAATRETILFFDEADALFGKRTGVRDSHDRYANQEVAYLIPRLTKQATVIVLAPAGRVRADLLPSGPLPLVVKPPPLPPPAAKTR